MHADSNIFFLAISQRIHGATLPKDHDNWKVALKSNHPLISPPSLGSWQVYPIQNGYAAVTLVPTFWNTNPNIGIRGVHQHREISHSWNSCSDTAFGMSISHTGGEAKTSLWDYPEHTREQVEDYSYVKLMPYHPFVKSRAKSLWKQLTARQDAFKEGTYIPYVSL